MTKRLLPDFITAFEQYAVTYNSTPLFAKFGAAWMVGTAVTRGVAMRSRGVALHPNLFVQLVAGPGTGKSQTIKAVREILIKATGMKLIPASVTRAGLEDFMNSNLQQRKDTSGNILLSHECIGLADEMQGILPDQDLGHLTLYNDLYDLHDRHDSVTRSHGAVNLEYPFISILCGAQPAFLAQAMPEGAWGMGFMSRSIMAFDVPAGRRSAFIDIEVDVKLRDALVHDLQQIHDLFGWLKWSKDAIALYEEWWVKEGGKPIPQAKRLVMGYNARREVHFLKLAMIMSLSRTNDLIVSVDDAAKAIKLMLETESRMQHIFAEMNNTGSMVAINDVLDAVRAATAAGGAMAEAELIHILMQRFPSTQVHAHIDNLIHAGAIKSVGGISAKGLRKFQAGSGVTIV